VKLFSEAAYISICRWWLSAILLFLPFQHKIIKLIGPLSKEFSSFIAYIDEITIVIFLLFTVREYYKRKEIPDKLYLILLSPIVILSIFGLISGIVNRNSLLITSLGIFDYIKNFLVIFIFAVFFKNSESFKKTFRLVLVVAIFLGVVAFIQEFWAVYSRYILKENINEISYLFTQNLIPELSWRVGIYRAPSLTHNSNIFGLYMLLILTVYLSLRKKINFVVFIPLFSGIFSSVSRMVYAGFIFIGGLHLIKYKRWIVAPLFIFIVAVFLYMAFLSDFNIWEWDLIEAKEGIPIEETGIKYVSYREYAKIKAVEIWKDHSLLGVGPGMYGGIISIKYHSPIYEKYNFQGIAMHYLKNWSGIDQHWHQILAEVGIIGVICFAWLFVSLAIMLFILKKKATTPETKGLYEGLLTYIVVILIYTFGSGLNITSVIFTYTALVGMGLGCVLLRKEN